MERAAAELFLASLFVEPTPERHEALKNAAQATRSWEGLLPALESHGVLGLFLRNLEAAGVELPTGVAGSFQARHGAQLDQSHRTRLGLVRFLAGAARAGVEVTLVGGSALCFDLYDAPLRRLGELELFVAPEHFARALAAAEQAGLLLAEGAMPAWWYRRAGLAVPLVASSARLADARLASTLHHPSLLLTARQPEVLARRRRVAHEGHPLFLLDPIDGLLELAVHVATRAGELALVSGRRHLLTAASGTPAHLSLDQILDLRTHIERRHAELAPAAVVARAREWNAEPALRAVLECLQMGLGFLPGPREWARQVTQILAAQATSSPRGAALALFRPDPIERLPQWLRPTEAYLAARYALPASSPSARRHLARARHLLEVLGLGVVAGLGFPLALLARRLARPARRASWQAAQTPERMSDVNDAWRAAARVEQPKSLTPKTIALPEREESVARFPDRYLG